MSVVTGERIDLKDIQGNILRGYHAEVVRHIVVRVNDKGAAKQILADSVCGDTMNSPQITTGEQWDVDAKPTTFLNVGITAHGLRALGLSDSSVQSFPEEFLAGPAARATKLGDVDESAPVNWQDGFDRPDDVHLMWSIHAATIELLEATCRRLEAIWARSDAFVVTSRRDGAALAGDRVHFGYRDSISQPRFEYESNSQPAVVGRRDQQPVAPLGAVLLGYETTFPDVLWQMPRPRELGINGCFNAFRILEQDVDAFEAFLELVVSEHGGPNRPFLTEEYVAAKLMGRWRNGVPLALWPDSSDASAPTRPTFLRSNLEDDLNAFDYPDIDPEWDDYEGLHCPLGAHIRRANPRGAQIVQRSANYTRRIVRRGIPYGPPYDQKNKHDNHPRGLLGNFLCASLIAQFESIMYDWVNLGLQDPRITGTNDPILGANKLSASRFEIPLKGEDPIVLSGFPRFIRTVGSAYLFMPSITALRLLANV